MKLEMLHGDSWAKTYLLIDEESKQAILIDSVFGRHEYDLSVIQARGA
ncbi:MAG TPA: MBL fold metallo-hydrolase, partial [Candidatus Poseidoniales archaeon]|nr:MBL fold metallo-hydrolase [Candidatus Poseidoniales archaeon]